eukprot:g12555.t1
MYANTKNGSPEVPDIHRKALSKKMSHADVMYERAALIKVFKALDADGNGVLTTGEVFKMLSFGAAKVFPLIKPFPVLASLFTTENIASAMKYADLDNNGEVDESEFLEILNSLRREEEERLALLDVYTALDVDGDSRLTAKEIERAMIYQKKKLKSLLHRFPVLVSICQQPKKFMIAVELADENNDGIVSSREFCELIKQIKRNNEQERKIKELFQFLDPSGKDLVNYADRLALLTIFSILDRNDDKTLSVRELKVELKRNANTIQPLLLKHPGLHDALEPNRFVAALKRMDTNRDGKVDVKEFVTFAQFLRKQRGGFTENRFHIH